MIDYGILAFLALSVVAGFYQGFVKTVLGIASFLEPICLRFCPILLLRDGLREPAG